MTGTGLVHFGILARNWPRLDSLAMDRSLGLGDRLESLAAFVRVNCPELSYLSVPDQNSR